MAVRYAVASGNWSNAAIWDNGAVPLNDDDVFANARTIVMDQNVTVNRITNAQSNTVIGGVHLPDMCVPQMTSNTTPEGVAFGGSNASFPAWQAFDRNPASQWASNTAGTGSIGYQFTSGKVIKQYAFLTHNLSQNLPSAWTFQGSNDGTAYTTIETVTGFTTAISTWYVRNVSANTTSYTYYRMNITAISSSTNTPIIRELQMTESTGSVYASGSGGRFLLTDGITLTATSKLVPYAPPASGSLILISGSNTATIIGNMRNDGTNAWPSDTAGIGIQILNSAKLTMTGSISGGKSFGSSYGVAISGSGAQFNILGNVETGPGDGGVSAQHGIFANVSGSVNINGEVSHWNKTSAAAANAIVFNSADTLTITGSIYQHGGSTQVTVASSTAGASIYISGSFINYDTSAITVSKTAGGGILEIKGPITGSPLINIIQNTSTTSLTRLTGPIRNVNGINAVLTPRIEFFSDSTLTINFPSNTFGREVTFYDTSFTSSLPAQTDVRSGSLYGGSNEYSGSMVVPLTSSVRYGVPVDNVTGSATIVSPQDIFDYAVTSLTGSNTIGERLKNISTVQTTAATIAAFKGK